MTVHLFEDSLAMSHAAADWPGWSPLYREFFPTLVGVHDHRQDGDHQRAGIDRSVVLSNAKTIWIDEKVRGRNKRTGKVYDDVLLEVLSNKERDVSGWVNKQIQADYIAYLIAPLGVCYLLPVLQMQLAWGRNGKVWTRQYGEREARNRDWTTVSVPVPVEVLYPAMGAGLRARFDPWEVDD